MLYRATIVQVGLLPKCYTYSRIKKAAYGCRFWIRRMQRNSEGGLRVWEKRLSAQGCKGSRRPVPVAAGAFFPAGGLSPFGLCLSFSFLAVE